MGDKKTVLEKINANKLKYFVPLLLVPLSSDNVQYTPMKIMPKEQSSKDVDAFAMFRKAEKEAFALIAFTENCHMKSYSCGIRETIGLGSTEDVDGNFIKKRSELSSMNDAYLLAKVHIEKRIYPHILKFVKHERLNTQQLAALVCAFYNLGCTNLTGYNEKMEKVGEMSELVKSINSGVDLDECGNRFMAYCRAGGKSSEGLKKRRYFEKHYFKGNITYAELLSFNVNKIYDFGPVGIFCAEKIGPKGYYVTKDDAMTLNKFKKFCSTGNEVKVGKMMKDLGFEINYHASSQDFAKTQVKVKMVGKNR